MQEHPLLASKTRMAEILDIDGRVLNKMIANRVIPGPLPGTRFLHVPSVLAALGKAAAAKTTKEARP
jgi:hypothetical protein